MQSMGFNEVQDDRKKEIHPPISLKWFPKI